MVNVIATLIVLLLGVLVPARAATVQHLNTQTATATGSGAAGIPSLTGVNIPSGKNRVLFIWATFERDHCSAADNTAGLCTNANTAGTGLGDNWPEPRTGTPPATTTNNQITARVIGAGGTVNKQNALVIGGTPSGDTRFITISNSPNPSPAGTAFFSVSSFHIVLFENEIRTLLNGAASGTVNISLPDVNAPSNPGDDAMLIASVFQNVEQSPTGFVRNATSTAQVSAGTPGNFPLAPAAYDAGQVPDEADDGKLVMATNSSTAGFTALAGHTNLATLSTTNAAGEFDTPNGNINDEPNGFSGVAYFRNGGATPNSLYSLQAGGAAATLVYGGTNASFLLESDNSDLGDAPVSYGNPSHILSGVRLGASVDADAAFLNSSDATGDDTDSTDDENGITIASVVAGAATSIPVSIQNGSGFLNAWFDWNNDGDFLDAGEQVATNQSVAVGTTNLSVTPPITASGNVFARFRVCATSGDCSSPFTTSQSGEVEDYRISVTPPFGGGPGASCATGQNQIANGDFTQFSGGNWPGWTTTGSWNGGSGSAIAFADGAVLTLTQSGLSNLNQGTGSYGAALIDVNMSWGNGSPAPSNTANWDIEVGGVRYARLTTPTGFGTVATITYENGATGNITTMAETVNTNWRIELPASVDASGSLSFRHTPTGGAGVSSDDFFLDRVEIARCTVSVGGLVWNDSNGNLSQGGGELGTNAGGLTIYAVDALGNVVDKATVGSNGVYTMNGLPQNTNLTLRLSTDSSATPGNPAPLAASLPSGWVNTGENINGFTETATPGEIALNTGTANIANMNFGIQHVPTATGGTGTANSSTGGNINVPAALFSSTDPDGVITKYTITAIPPSVDSITINGVTYSSSNPLPPGGVDVPANPDGSFPSGAVSFDPQDGVTSVVIPFTVTDNAGAVSSLANATVLASAAGTVWIDSNSNQLLDGGESGSNVSSSTLTVYLADASNVVVAKAVVTLNGAFSFFGIASGTYTMILSNDSSIAVGAAPPAPSVPSGYGTSGENTGDPSTGTRDANPDGKITITVP
jgi:GEVED domain